MAVFSGGVPQRDIASNVVSSEVDITSHSVFYNLIFVAMAAGLVWSAIGFAIL